ncbi:MAG: hypothetical protein M0C28_19015 [Candidatus Moduliflexus flocculans]|nr:hypothetical protein [Candidatus Moduliflexus flocculans]
MDDYSIFGVRPAEQSAHFCHFSQNHRKLGKRAISLISLFGIFADGVSASLERQGVTLRHGNPPPFHRFQATDTQVCRNHSVRIYIDFL